MSQAKLTLEHKAYIYLRIGQFASIAKVTKELLDEKIAEKNHFDPLQISMQSVNTHTKTKAAQKKISKVRDNYFGDMNDYIKDHKKLRLAKLDEIIDNPTNTAHVKILAIKQAQSELESDLNREALSKSGQTTVNINQKMLEYYDKKLKDVNGD